MKDSKRDNRENWLLLISFGCVLLAAAAVLLLLHHAKPRGAEGRGYGGGVSLLLAHTPEERNEFRRWTELNDPSRMFGYNSVGIFSASVERKTPLKVPVLRSFIQESFDNALYMSSEQKMEPLKIENSAAALIVPRRSLSMQKSPFVFAGLPVFNEKGEELIRLEGIPETNMVNVLLIRAGHNMAGQEFRIVGSSGDRRFDRSVAKALSKFADKGKRCSGILAVWPESGEMKK